MPSVALLYTVAPYIDERGERVVEAFTLSVMCVVWGY